MGKTPASTRAGRKPKSKNPERKWCTCQEHCGGGKEVAASTYRSHNPTTMRATTVRDGFAEDASSVVGVGGKRKAGSDMNTLDLEGGIRETRRMRARRIAQGGEAMPLRTTEDLADTPEPGHLRSQETKAVGRLVNRFFEGANKESKRSHHEAQAQECVQGDDEEDEEPSWIPSVEVYPIESGIDIDDDYEDDDQLRATLRSVNKMVSAILSWD